MATTASRQLRVVPVGVDVDEVQRPSGRRGGRGASAGGGGPVQEAGGLEPRQLAALGDPQDLFDQPPHPPVADRPVGQRGDGRAEGREQSRRTSSHSDIRRPLVATYCALASNISLGMSTAAGHSQRHWWQLTHRSATALNSSSCRPAGSRLAGEDAAHQVGLGARRRFLARSEAEDRAHPFLGALGAAPPAAVAGWAAWRNSSPRQTSCKGRAGPAARGHAGGGRRLARPARAAGPCSAAAARPPRSCPG